MTANPGPKFPPAVSNAESEKPSPRQPKQKKSDLDNMCLDAITYGAVLSHLYPCTLLHV